MGTGDGVGEQVAAAPDKKTGENVYEIKQLPTEAQTHNSREVLMRAGFTSD